MVFYLQPFAKVADAAAGFTRERLQRQKRFVLLWREVRLLRQSALAEGEELSHRVSKGGERFVILWMQLGYHRGKNYRTVIFLQSQKKEILKPGDRKSVV